MESVLSNESLLVSANDEFCNECLDFHNPMVNCRPCMKPIDMVEIEKIFYWYELEKFRKLFE